MHNKVRKTYLDASAEDFAAKITGSVGINQARFTHFPDFTIS